ncbi:hypothetical protein JG688_00017074 [Phytophthora aleatoria]|uniref:Uncharacterized protein n=1 Tax=Phytophthora aleatoria TaxID=2496075 RepID=A0A8J5LYR7_9STRA|nr:hypothetical protein JG688_00017074 [Phytophthora aleatoria]
MMTPVFGGAPPPTWANSASDLRTAQKRDKLAEYLLTAFTEWTANGPTCSLDADGLLSGCNNWDRSSASLIDRQCCRYIRNMMKKDIGTIGMNKLQLIGETEA